jgi:hypothetical protein
MGFQILDEPAARYGLPPDVYVQEILRPSLFDWHAFNRRSIVVSAAPESSEDGVRRLRAMLEAGLEDSADRIALKFFDLSTLPELARVEVRNFIWILESGVPRTEAHLAWVRDTYAQVSAAVRDATRIFFYVLYEPESGRYRLIDIRRSGAGYEAVAESSALIEHLRGVVRESAAGHPLFPFEALVPDIRFYFPTAADAAVYDEMVMP